MKSLTSIIQVVFLLTALAISNRSHGQNSLHQDTLYRLGVATYLSTGKIDSAILAANQLDGNNKANEKNTLLGMLYEKKGDTVSANAYFAKSLNDPETNPARIHFGLAMVAFHRNDIPAAKQQLLQSVQQDATNPKRFFLLGKLYTYLNQPDSAMINYRLAYGLDSSNSAYAQAVHASYHNKGMVRESLPFLAKWASADTVTAATQLALAAQLIQLDSFAAAIPLLHRVVRRAPMNDTAWYDLGLAELQTGDSLEGLRHLRQSTFVAKTAVRAVYDVLAATYEAEGRIYEMMSVIRQGSREGITYYTGWLAQYQSSLADARRLDSSFRQDNPTDQLKDLLSLASLSAFHRNDRRTLKFLQLYSSMHGQPTDSMLILKARAEMGIGRLQQAMADVQTAIRMNPQATGYQALLAAILYRMKDYKDLVAALLPLDPARMPNVGISTEDRSALLFKAYTLLGDTGNAQKYFQGD